MCYNCASFQWFFLLHFVYSSWTEGAKNELRSKNCFINRLKSNMLIFILKIMSRIFSIENEVMTILEMLLICVVCLLTKLMSLVLPCYVKNNNLIIFNSWKYDGTSAITKLNFALGINVKQLKWKKFKEICFDGK